MAWKPDWMKSPEERAAGGNDNKDDKDKLPKELEDRFKQVTEDVTKTLTSQMEEKLKGLESITAFVDEQRKEVEKKKNTPPPKKDPNEGKTQDEINAEFVSKFAENPLAALREVMTPAQEAILLTRADNVKREVFTDRADEFPYYTGDFKREIDEILGKQNLQFRNDPVAVANVYYTVTGKRHKEIEEGKIKSRFASATAPAGKRPGAGGESEKKEIVLTDEMKRAAKLMGFSEKEYKEILEKEEEVNV